MCRRQYIIRSIVGKGVYVIQESFDIAAKWTTQNDTKLIGITMNVVRLYQLKRTCISQKRALKCIFPDKSYADILHYLGLQTLKQRPDCQCERYFDKKKVSSHKLSHLLPDKIYNRL